MKNHNAHLVFYNDLFKTSLFIDFKFVCCVQKADYRFSPYSVRVNTAVSPF